MLSNLIRPFAAALVHLAFLGVSAGIPTSNAAECKSVRGFLEETIVPAPACTSAVGLCTVAQMFGSFKGQAHFTASAVIPSSDTPTTGVVFVTGDSIVADAKLGAKLGTLSVKNAAAFRTVGGGDLTDTQVIIGGTGDFAGATGSFRVTGTFVNGAGTSSFEGSVCVP